MLASSCADRYQAGSIFRGFGSNSIRINGRVLIVAGSDSGGGAGIQADIKAVTALGGFAMTAITALTAQNTLGVHGIHGVPPDFIRAQFEAVATDIGVDAIKLGMLHDIPTIEVVARAIRERAPGVPVIADPVMVAKGGAPLLAPGAVDAWKSLLLPLATLVTPNAPEAEALTGSAVGNTADAERAALSLVRAGAAAALVKGGHLGGARLVDVLAIGEAITRIDGPRHDTAHTHGTGCTLASAIAAGVARGDDLRESVDRAIRYVRKAIETAPGLGGGHGPLNHLHPLTLDPDLA